MVIYLFKLLRLLHERIDPTVEELRKNSLTLKPKKAENISTSCVPPIGAPSWCLNQEALERFNRSSANIPVYDSDDTQDNIDNDIEDEEIQSRTNSDRRKKRKTKKKAKQNRNKKHK
jgi:hypothetical protein